MPLEAKPLFRPDVLRKHLAHFNLPAAVKNLLTVSRQPRAHVDPANLASVKILEKLGLTSAGSVEYQGKSFAKYVLHLGVTGTS